MRDTFSAQPFKHPFGDSPDAAQRSINKWVENKSGKTIKKLMPPGNYKKMYLIMIT